MTPTTNDNNNNNNDDAKHRRSSPCMTVESADLALAQGGLGLLLLLTEHYRQDHAYAFFIYFTFPPS